MSKPIFSKEAFLDFARSKDPNEEFRYLNGQTCACSQYCSSIGLNYHRDQRVRLSCLDSGIEHLASHASIEYSSDNDITERVCSWGYLVEYIEGDLNKSKTRRVVERPSRLFYALWC